MDDLVDKVSIDIINYNNKDNYSLKEVFNIITDKYNINDIDIFMVKVISCISYYGYDIVSTHPFKLKRYK